MESYMSYNLNSLKGVIWGIIYGTTIEVIRGILGVETIAHIMLIMLNGGIRPAFEGGRRFAEQTMHNRSVYAWLQNRRTRMISICLTFFTPIMPL